jgi:mannose-6-phosphate isomerase-like protein (cupin superfamily)
MQLPNIKFTYEEFEEYILSEEAFLYDRTFTIDKFLKDDKIESDTYEEYYAKLQIKLAEQHDTLKVEGIELLYGFEHGTIHAFRYWKDSPSFPVHTDPVDVILEVHEGEKFIEVNGEMHNIIKGETISIPANTPHRALNEKQGLMLSYGLHNTEKP